MTIKKIVASEDLELRQLAVQDAEELFQLTDRNRGHLRVWLPWLDYNKEEKDSLFFINGTIEQDKKNNGTIYGLWYKESISGVIGHHFIDWNNKRTSLGYWLGKEFEKNGIITLACRVLINQAFNELHLNKVVIAAAVENKKSRAIPEKLGLKQDGILRENEWLYDHFVDHVEYSVLKKDWEKN